MGGGGAVFTAGSAADRADVFPSCFQLRHAAFDPPAIPLRGRHSDGRLCGNTHTGICRHSEWVQGAIRAVPVLHLRYSADVVCGFRRVYIELEAASAGAEQEDQ